MSAQLHYLLLEQDRIGAALHRREDDDWRWAEFGDPQAELTLPCAGLKVRLAELYEGTGLPETLPDAEGSS